MLNKFRLGADNDLNAYYKSENMGNTDFPFYENINPQRPDAFIGFTSNMFISPQSILFEPENLDNYGGI